VAVLLTIRRIWWVAEWFFLITNWVFGIILCDLRMGLILRSITFLNNFPNTGKRLVGQFFALLGLCRTVITDSSKLKGSKTISGVYYLCVVSGFYF